MTAVYNYNCENSLFKGLNCGFGVGLLQRRLCNWYSEVRSLQSSVICTVQLYSLIPRTLLRWEEESSLKNKFFPVESPGKRLKYIKISVE